MSNAYTPFNQPISENKDIGQDSKTQGLYYITDSDCPQHRTSEGSIHGPSMLQQMAQGLSKLLIT
jgi:hypothetical protein